MRNKLSTVVLIWIILTSLLSGCAATDRSAGDAAKTGEVLYQVSTLDALMQGVYDGAISLESLVGHGDFGIGTFDALEGEMVVLDGDVYQVLVSGEVAKPDLSVKTPFAMVTDFSADQEEAVVDIADYAQLTQEISALLPSDNIFYAVKVEGTFPYVKTRSVAKQSEPYPTLAEVTSDQQVFEFHDVKGTLVGYWCPAYISGVNLSGFHLHFLSDDRRMGGHLLECSIAEGTIGIDTMTEFDMLLPENTHFLSTDLSGVTEEDKQDVEQ